MTTYGGERELMDKVRDSVEEASYYFGELYFRAVDNRKQLDEAREQLVAKDDQLYEIQRLLVDVILAFVGGSELATKRLAELGIKVGVSAEELDLLPPGSRVLDHFGSFWVKSVDGVWKSDGSYDIVSGKGFFGGECGGQLNPVMVISERYRVILV